MGLRGSCASIAKAWAVSDRLHQLAHGANAQRHITQPQHTQFPEHSSFRVLSSAARLRLVASPLEMNHTIIDVVIDRPKLYITRPTTKVFGPAAQNCVELISHFMPCADVTWLQ